MTEKTHLGNKKENMFSDRLVGFELSEIRSTISQFIKSFYKRDELGPRTVKERPSCVPILLTFQRLSEFMFLQDVSFSLYRVSQHSLILIFT